MYRPPVAIPTQPAIANQTNKMAEKKTVKKADPRQANWEQHLAAYKAKNPVKFAAKEKAGQFDSIPDTFVVGDALVEYK